MSVHHRKIKILQLGLGEEGAVEQFECQVQSWNMVNNTEDGDKQYAQCPDGEFREPGDPDWALEVTFYADWRSSGISDFLWRNRGKEVPFTLDHHPDIPEEHVRWTGVLLVKAPSVGGEPRQTETHEMTFNIKGEPVFERVTVTP